MRVDARAAHKPVDAGADAQVIGLEVGVRGLAVGRGPGDLVAAVPPRRPVPRHADVAAVLPAYLRLSVRRGTADGHREAVGAVPETARAGLAEGNRPGAAPPAHTRPAAGRRDRRPRD